MTPTKTLVKHRHRSYHEDPSMQEESGTQDNAPQTPFSFLTRLTSAPSGHERFNRQFRECSDALIGASIQERDSLVFSATDSNATKALIPHSPYNMSSNPKPLGSNRRLKGPSDKELHNMSGDVRNIRGPKRGRKAGAYTSLVRSNTETNWDSQVIEQNEEKRKNLLGNQSDYSNMSLVQSDARLLTARGRNLRSDNKSFLSNSSADKADSCTKEQ